MSRPATPAPCFAARRTELMRMIGREAIAVVPGARLAVRNGDVHYRFRQNSDFWYLTGFDEPDAVLVLIPGRAAGETIVFCRPRNPERERWDGPRAGLEGARRWLSADDAFPIDDLDDVMPGLLENRSRVHYQIGRDPAFDERLLHGLNRLHSGRRPAHIPPEDLIGFGHTLHELRLLKSRDELKWIRRAVAISCAAHERVLAGLRPGRNERDIAADLLHEFHRHGLEAAYQPIVGGGAHACTLHYIANDAELKDGEMVLIDAGCEYEKYAADLTRTWPVNGRFSKAQRALYEVVLAAQHAALAQVRPGAAWQAVHDAAFAAITQGLIDLGLLPGSFSEQLEAGGAKRFFMHKTGHWLGLDVHDVGDYQIDGHSRALEPGMVMTVEPGLYIPPDATEVAAEWRGIGIRIEDNVAVTREGCEVLSEALVREPDAIERRMKQGRAA